MSHWVRAFLLEEEKKSDRGKHAFWHFTSVTINCLSANPSLVLTHDLVLKKLPKKIAFVEAVVFNLLCRHILKGFQRKMRLLKCFADKKWHSLHKSYREIEINKSSLHCQRLRTRHSFAHVCPGGTDSVKKLRFSGKRNCSKGFLGACIASSLLPPK